MKKLCWIVYALALAVWGGAAKAQAPANPRALNVTALDESGQPITDLTSADFQIFDDEKPQTVTGFHALFPADKKMPPPTTLVLLDLLNAFAGERENSATLVVRALQPLGPGNSIYLYLLTNRGELLNVHDAAAAQKTAGTSDSPWTRQVQPLLDEAIQKANAMRIKDFQDEGGIAAATFFALNDIGGAFMKIPGPKTIVWMTRGTPNWLDYRYGCKDVMFPDGQSTFLGGRCGDNCTRRNGMAKCVDYTPFLQRFGGRLARTDTEFYTVMVDPQGAVFNSDRGRPKDTLIQLADLTGGKMYQHGEIDTAITESLKAARARYQITYDAPEPNGKYHKLRVECSRKGARVEAPPGYYSEEPQKK